MYIIIRMIYIYIISWCILHQWCRRVPIKVGVNGAVPGSDSVPSGLRDLTSGQTVHDCAMHAGSSLLLYLWCKDVFSIFFYIFMHFTLQVAGPKSMNSPLWCIPFKSILLRYGRDDMIVKRCWRVLKFKLQTEGPIGPPSAFPGVEPKPRVSNGTRPIGQFYLSGNWHALGTKWGATQATANETASLLSILVNMSSVVAGPSYGLSCSSWCLECQSPRDEEKWRGPICAREFTCF